jgi:hypothetical protein
VENDAGGAEGSTLTDSTAKFLEGVIERTRLREGAAAKIDYEGTFRRVQGHLKHCVVERNKMREALRAAHHELTTVHGLYAVDLRPDRDAFQIDKLAVLKQIEEALGDAR